MNKFDRNIKWTSKIVRGKEVPVIFYKFKKDRVLDDYEKVTGKFFKNSPRVFLICGVRDVLGVYKVLRHRLKKLVAIGWWRQLKRNPKLIFWFLDQCRIDSLITYSWTLLKMGPAKLKYVQILEVQGAPKIGQKDKKLLRKFFPKAKFMRVYGFSEIDKIGFQCEYLARNLSDRYHFSSEVCPEISPSGELLVSVPKRFNKSFVRCGTGDRAKIHYQKCPCGHMEIVEILNENG